MLKVLLYEQIFFVFYYFIYGIVGNIARSSK